MSVFSVNSNLAAFQGVRALERINQRQEKSSERLSSGLRLNRAADDAAGVAIAGLMKSQIMGTTVGSRNAQDGISLLQVGEGGLDTIGGMLRRIRNLAIQSANDTLTDSDRTNIQKEVDQIISEIGRQSDAVNFNAKKILNGDFAGIGTTTITPPGAPTNQTTDSSGVTQADARPNYYHFATAVAPTATAPAGGGEIEFVDGFYASSSTPGGGSFTNTTGVAGNRAVMRFQYQFSGTSSEITNVAFRFVGGTAVDGATDTATIQLYDFQAGSWVTVTTNSGSLAVPADTTGSNSTNPSRFVDGSGDIWAQAFTTTATAGGGNTAQLLIDYASLTVTTQTPGSSSTTASPGLFIQSGANKGENIEVFLPSTSTTGLGVSTLSVSTRVRAESAIALIDNALSKVDGERARIGSQLNRAQSAIRNNETKKEKETSARSRIEDTEYDREILEFTKDQILQQSALSAIAQANLMPQAILQLLR